MGSYEDIPSPLTNTQFQCMGPFAFMCYQEEIRLFVCPQFLLSPARRLCPYQAGDRVTGEFPPQALLISSTKLALSCVWKTSVEFFGRNANSFCFSRGDVTGMQTRREYPCTCQHTHTGGDTGCVMQFGATALNECFILFILAAVFRNVYPWLSC